MPNLLVITHPEVTIDPDIPITDWRLSAMGRRRATHFAATGVLTDVTRIWSSTEQKARDTAEILSVPRNLPIDHSPGLGENDRSATGFLPREEFEAAADAFFARPEASFRGWETAAEAQRRIHATVSAIVEAHEGKDLAIVTHGAVATLLWCAFSNCLIDRNYDQPSQGHYWLADLLTLRPQTGWLAMA